MKICALSVILIVSCAVADADLLVVLNTNNGAILTIVSRTISGNAAQFGGGIQLDGASPSLTLENSIVADNDGIDGLRRPQASPLTERGGGQDVVVANPQRLCGSCLRHDCGLFIRFYTT